MRKFSVVNSETIETKSDLTFDEFARLQLEKALAENPTGLVIVYETPKKSTLFRSVPDGAYVINGLIDTAFDIIHGDDD